MGKGTIVTWFPNWLRRCWLPQAFKLFLAFVDLQFSIHLIHHVTMSHAWCTCEHKHSSCKEEGAKAATVTEKSVRGRRQAEAFNHL